MEEIQTNQNTEIEEAEQRAESAIELLLRHIEGDEALDNGQLREGLADTPTRVVKSWKTIFSGYGQSVSDILKTDFNAEGYDGIVLLKDIQYYSTCEHHMLTFNGKAHVAYIPTNRIVGVSKLARLVELFARRLQNQERITRQIADAIESHINPLGVAVILEGQHLCMACRGVQKDEAIMKTSAMRGAFFDNDKARAELMQLMN